ncbi:hypothetical protein PR202_gb22461 [Eleusine coracana subsp. coracana]|uniref:Uncharacterized protein n=1 Tax=Eleusine coracana subsp. coracana TaxID=191504 RepID=A0AAV5FHC2_ELECO|nr:hypothetical protein PR202_gb22461 [Eleusine coracana subsp. coracana]
MIPCVSAVAISKRQVQSGGFSDLRGSMVGVGAGLGFGMEGTGCGALLRELQQIWTEVGESEGEKNKVLLEIDRECLEVYRRKVEDANRTRVQLHQSVAAKEAEVASLIATLGEHKLYLKFHGNDGICWMLLITCIVQSERLHKVLEYINEVHSLCGVLGIDFGKTVNEVHPSLHQNGVEQSRNISNSTLEGLASTISNLKAERKSRIYKMRETMESLCQLWKLMDSPEEEKRQFNKVMSILILPEEGITTSLGILSEEIIKKMETEVERLTKLKVSRLKEIVMKRRAELEEICQNAHIEPDVSTAPEQTDAMIDSGLIDPSELLANIESQILKVKEESLSRKDIMDRINKWIAACDEEAWLEEYNQDQKKLESILLAEKQAIFGSKPSQKWASSLNRKTNGYRSNGTSNGLKTPTPRRSSLGSATPELLTPRSYSGHNRYFGDLRRLSTSQLNFGDDSLSTFTSISGSEPESPSLG